MSTTIGWGGYPTVDLPSAALTAPVGVLEIGGRPAPSGNGAWQSPVSVTLAAPPAGAAQIRVWAWDADWQAVTDARGRPWVGTADAVEGAVELGSLPPLAAGEAQSVRHLRLAFLGAGGAVGELSASQELLQRAADRALPLEFTVPPALVIGEGGLIAGSTAPGATQGAFTGDTDGFAEVSFWVTEASTDDPITMGQPALDYVPGEPIPANLQSYWLWVMATITDGTSTVVEWSRNPHQITEPVAPGDDIVLTAADIEILEVWETATAGLWQFAIRISSKVSTIDPDTTIRVCFSHAAADPDRVLAAWMPVIPGEAIDGYSPPLTDHNPAYTRLNRVYRLSRRADQAGTGTQWTDPWALKVGRQQDETEPRRGLWKWQIVEGTKFHPISPDNVFIVPPAPDPTERPPVTDLVYRSLEVGPGHVGGRYGFGIQFMRCMMACEDAPDFVIGGGDMNGVRLSEAMGRTWRHDRGRGRKAFAFNSVAIDPRNQNYLLALGGVAWYSIQSAKWDVLIGIYRSTDLGGTWDFVQRVDTASNDQWNQSLFCYDPQSRSKVPGERVWYLMNRKRITRANSPDATAVELWRSPDGGASWSLVWSTTDVAKFGQIYKLRAHPTDGTFWLATSTGLWRSSLTTISWNRVGGTGFPTGNQRVTAVEISPNGQRAYASIRGGALWYTTNNGGSWSKVYDAHAVRRVAVNWSTTTETVFLQLQRAANPRVVISDGPNGPWTTASIVEDPGRAGGNISTDSSLEFDGMICPNSPGVCIINSSGRVWLCDDKKTFENSCWGFTGANGASAGQLLAVHPTDPNRWGLAIQDNALIYTADGSAHFRERLPKRGKSGVEADTGYSIGTGSCYSIAIASTGRILVGYGETTKQIMAYSDEIDAASPNFLANTAFAQRVHSLWRHPTAAGDVIVANDMVTKDRGQSVAYGANGRCTGLDKSGAAYFVRGNVGGSSANRQIYRSANWHSVSAAGQITYTPFYDGQEKFEKSGREHNALASVSPATTNVVWLRGDNGDLCRVYNPGSMFDTAVVLSAGLKAYPGVPQGNLFDISDIAADPRDPTLCYCTLLCSGYAAWIFRVRTNAAGTAIASIEEISGNAPHFMGTSCHVHPRTGDLVISGGVGTWAVSAPDGYAAAFDADPSFVSKLPVPVGYTAPAPGRAFSSAFSGAFG